MNFGARAARALIAHFPKIFLFAKFQNTVFGQHGAPDIVGFLVKRHAFSLIAFKDGYIQPVFRDLINFGQEFPGPGQGIFFKVIAKGPVSEHFEHGMVVAIHAHIFQIIVFATYAKAFLGIGYALCRGCLVAEKKILQRRHARVNEHERRVALRHHGRRGNDFMAFGCKKI